MRQQLRDYQIRGLNEILAAFRGGARSVLVVSPTGSGKTTIFSDLIASVQSRVVVLVHRRELATQASNRLREFGVDHGFIMAGEPRRAFARVQIASVQTLVRRQAPTASLVIVDEAHLSTAETWRKVIGQYPGAKILGFTATPYRLSGKPLAGQYDRCVVVAQPGELREQGHLCPYVGFSYKAPDLSDVEKVGDDYNQGQAAEKMSAIVPNVVEQWQAHASHLSTVVFAVTVEHSQKLTAEFRAAGVRAEHLDGSTTIEQRKAILARVERGETRVLCNVGVAVEGLDIPRLKCCVLARPTMSLARAIQMMGRVRRPWNGEVARIHDHAFVIGQHGLPDADRDYTLHAKPEKPPALTTCNMCLAMYSGPKCPACDHENETAIRAERELKEILDAELFDFSSADAPAPPPPETKKPPVVVEWSAIGKSFEGVFKSVSELPSQFGPRKHYLIAGKRRDYQLPGTVTLDRLFERVTPGQLVRVTFTGEEMLPGAKWRKRFKLEVDNGAKAAA
jgi:DNA repair protein RadD